MSEQYSKMYPQCGCFNLHTRELDRGVGAVTEKHCPDCGLSQSGFIFKTETNSSNIPLLS
jgi:hypothetical protein